MSYLLQEGFGSGDPDLGKKQFHVIQVTQVASHDVFGTSRDGKFHKMVVALVRQVGAPRVIDSRPLAAGKKDVHQFDALRRTQPASPEQFLAADDVFVLVEQRIPHQRYAMAAQAGGDDRTCRTGTQAGAKEDVGIDHDFHV